jgi:serine/threonine protein kinase
MAVIKGARLLFEWLTKQRAGTVVSYEEIMHVTNWNEASLQTYINKNKITRFLQPLQGRRLKALLDGQEITERFFDETFTQKAPRYLTLSPGGRLRGSNGTYEIVEPLGNGAVGHVWSAKLKDSVDFVAAKIMLPRQDLLQDSKLPDVRERFRREAKFGQTLIHQNIVRYLDYGEAEGNPFLIMELADSSVADKIRKSGEIPQEEAAEIIEDCVNALTYLHGKGCPHRDVKPANLLRFSDTIKLGDLGIVKWSDFDQTFTSGGTITRQSVQLGSWFYMAPEQQESPHDAVQASDIYALGVTWIEMLTGNVPSPQAIGQSAYKMPKVPKDICELIKRMHLYNPSDRPVLTEIRQTIQGAY